jgi:hypothetical protein
MKKLSILFIPTLLLVGACSNKSSTTDTTQAESGVAETSASVDTTITAGSSVSDSAPVVETTSSDVSAESVASADSEVESSDSTVSVVSSEVSADSSTVPAAVPDSAPTQAVSQVSVQPGQSTDKFVGAASDVTTDVCTQDGGTWKVSGKVKNSSGAAANYRIYVALNRKGSTDTRGLLQVDKTVQDGKSEDWSTSAELADVDLICILRVERTAAK